MVVSGAPVSGSAISASKIQQQEGAINAATRSQPSFGARVNVNVSISARTSGKPR